MTLERILTIVTLILGIGTIAGVFINFSKVLDRNTIAINAINDTIKAQWTRIDEHGTVLENHSGRIIQIETIHQMRGCAEVKR